MIHLHTHTMLGKVSDDKEAYELYAASLLSHLGTSIVSIFLPILMLGLGYSLAFVAGYFLAYFLMSFLSHRCIAYKVISGFGTKKSLSLALFLQALGYASVAISGTDFILSVLVVGLVVLSVSEALRWEAYHVDFLRFVDQNRESAQISFTQIMNRVGVVGGPLIAGLSSALFGPVFTLWLGAGMLAFSGVPLLFTKDFYPEYKESEKRGAANRRQLLANFGINFDSNTSVLIWPIFLYILFDNNFSSTGILISAGFMISAIGIAILARVSDRNDDYKDKIMLSMTITRAITHLLRAISVVPVFAIFTNMLGELGSMQKPSSYIARFYDHGKRAKNPLLYIRSVEQAAGLGRSASWAVFLVGVIFIEAFAFEIIFIVAATLSLLMLKMRKRASG